MQIKKNAEPHIYVVRVVVAVVVIVVVAKPRILKLDKATIFIQHTIAPIIYKLNSENHQINKRKKKRKKEK